MGKEIRDKGRGKEEMKFDNEIKEVLIRAVSNRAVWSADLKMKVIKSILEGE